MEKQIQKLIPLTEATYFILLAFYQPLHGYGVIKKVSDMTQGRLTLAAGTLYGVIQSLLRYKLIQLVSEEKENKKKKSYQITDLGKSLIDIELQRLEQMVANGREVSTYGKSD